MRLHRGGIAMVAGMALLAPPAAAAQTFVGAGAEESYVVPDGAGSLSVLAVGARGGSADTNGSNGASGGFGATVQATLPVHAGEVIYVDIGENGPDAAGATGGTPSPNYLFTGGSGGSVSGASTDAGGAGGGASELRSCPLTAGLSCAFTPPLLAAAGGGGGGGGASGGVGGAAGAPGGLGTATTAAQPGTLAQTTNKGTPGGADGSLIVGGEGAAGGSSGFFTAGGGGGGGGGYFGGGGGGTVTLFPIAEYGGGGAGGSSFVDASATMKSIGPDSTGKPQIVLTPLPKVPSCAGNALNTLPGGSAISVVLPCSTPMGIAVAYSIASGPSHGTLGAIDQSAGIVRYTPAAGFTGTDTFTYTAANPTGPATAATATITVPPAQTTNPPPPAHYCVVPRLAGRSLSAASKQLAAAGCRLGTVTRPKTRKHHRPPAHLVVVRQGAPVGTKLAVGTPVAITLGTAGTGKRRHKSQ